MDSHPALDISGVDGDLVLALVDDYSPTAVEEHDGSLTIFFPDPARRDEAHEAVARAWPDALTASRDVIDGDWARRSQENLTPVTIGRVTVAPPWAVPQTVTSSLQPLTARGESPTAFGRRCIPPGCVASRSNTPGILTRRALPQPDASLLPGALGATPDFHHRLLTVIIEPSMAFGTGHHATTRLCLEALQALDDPDGFVLDVGTGSGVLAITARQLGARRVLGIDNNPEAVRCAHDNLRLNRGVDGVAFQTADLTSWDETLVPAADVVTANLTGSLLCRSAPALVAALAPGGTLIVSGLLEEERQAVVDVYGGLERAWESAEDGWVSLSFRRAR